MAFYIKKEVNGVEQEPKRVGVIPNGYPARKIVHSSGGNLEEMLNYSTDEHIVGKWIDGSILYAKTVDLGVMPNATSKTVATGIGANAVIRHVEEIMRHTNGKYAQKIESASSSSDLTHWYFNDADFIVTSTVNLSSWVGEITIFYTKTA